MGNLTNTFRPPLASDPSTMAEFPTIKSEHSLVAKHVTKEKWDKLSGHKTATSGFTLAQAIACAVDFDDQHCGIYAGDGDSYKDFAEVFDPIIKFEGDLSGEYFPLTGMDEAVRQQLVDDHFLFMSGDKNLQAAGMERDWPEGRGIFHNKEKTFLVWVNEEDQLRIISMQQGGDVKGVFERLSRGISTVGDSVKADSGKEFMLDPKYGYLQLQPRGTRGESGGQTGITYDISNKHRLGYTEVELVQKMIDGVNTLWKEDKELVAKQSA